MGRNRLATCRLIPNICCPSYKRWIEAEREEALLGKGEARDGKGGVVHEEKAFLSLGHGPRICPGQVRKRLCGFGKVRRVVLWNLPGNFRE